MIGLDHHRLLDDEGPGEDPRNMELCESTAPEYFQGVEWMSTSEKADSRKEGSSKIRPAYCQHVRRPNRRVLDQ